MYSSTASSVQPSTPLKHSPLLVCRTRTDSSNVNVCELMLIVSDTFASHGTSHACDCVPSVDSDDCRVEPEMTASASQLALVSACSA